MQSKNCKHDLNIAIQKLEAREESINQIEQLSSLGSWEIDLINNKTKYSDNQYKIYGLVKGEDTPGRELLISLLLPQYVQQIEIAIQESIKSKKTSRLQVQIKRKNDGKIIDVMYVGKTIFDGNVPIKIIGSAQDITEQIESKRHSQELSNMVEYSSTEVYIIDKDTFKYLYANQGAIDALGYTLEELLTMSIFDTNPDMTKAEAKRIKKDTIGNSYVINRTTHQRKDGSTYFVQAYLHPLKYNNEDTFVLFDTDITEIVELENKLRHQVNHDILTGLPNRALFKDRLSQALKTSARNKENFALLFIDLDKFKQINDSLGHNIGDKVLIEASLRLKNSIRDEDTLARIGGDEFVIILRNLKDSNCSATVAQKIINSIKEEMEIDGQTLFISASIGIALCPVDTTNESSLIKFADMAMYKAKESGDGFMFYDDII